VTDRYAVMGNPVSHSKSPAIHAAFAQQTGEALTYEAIHVEEGSFADAVSQFFNTGGKGLNITVPFKQEAWELAASLSEGAQLAGAVNTLFEDTEGRLCGHNTDGPGLVRDMCQNQGGTIEGKRLLVLGAGGAARGIILPILKEAPAAITIVNRTPQRATELATLFKDHGHVSACTFEELPGMQFDWVINATSASLQGDLPPLPNDLLAPGAWCYDLMYADTDTPFIVWANEHGAEKAIDGLGMLVEQAAESFQLWRGVRPDTKNVIASLRK
jgi:shikimate dehydrogenase